MQKLLIMLACIVPIGNATPWLRPTINTAIQPEQALANPAQSGQISRQSIAANAPPSTQFWQTLHHELRWPIPNHRVIQQQQQRYLKDPYHFHQVTQRAQPYLSWIATQLRQRQLPMELLLLPMVESAFDPYAHSNKGAAGLWQITRQTGRHYGVTTNATYDGRRDIVQSTETALTLLSELNQRFNGDWLLTVAAYNGGATRISQAIKLQQQHSPEQPLDFWSLKLPAETKSHVIKLLALSAILQHPQQHGMYFPPLDPQQELVYIDVGCPFSLSRIATLTNLPLDSLKSFNPGYRQETTGPNGPYHLLLPRNRICHFKQTLAQAKCPHQLLIVNSGKPAGKSNTQPLADKL